MNQAFMPRYSAVTATAEVEIESVATAQMEDYLKAYVVERVLEAST
jgi:hypothetical protein